MFHAPPFQLVRFVFRVRNCCCVPDLVSTSIFESAIYPPLDHPPSESASVPLTWMRRRCVACDTAQTFVFASSARVGTTARFSAPRQKLSSALPGSSVRQSALDRTAPVIV